MTHDDTEIIPPIHQRLFDVERAVDRVTIARETADLLTGRSLCCGLPKANRTRIAYQLADYLYELAARECDHCRISPDGRCRYCRAVVVEGCL